MGNEVPKQLLLDTCCRGLCVLLSPETSLLDSRQGVEIGWKVEETDSGCFRSLLGDRALPPAVFNKTAAFRPGTGAIPSSQ